MCVCGVCVCVCNECLNTNLSLYILAGTDSKVSKVGSLSSSYYTEV